MNALMSDQLKSKISDVDRILRNARMVHSEGKAITATCLLFSGGGDSTVLAHLLRGRADYAVHCNTTIGATETRAFVERTAAQFGFLLITETAPESYADHVRKHGFPGPAQHYRMYQRLKERALRIVRRSLIKDGRRQRVLFVAGRRRSESSRRANVAEHERIDSVIWASPLANWTKDDLAEYRAWAEAVGDPVPVNALAVRAGMSMECCCGAFAEPGEFDMIAVNAPDVAAQILALEAEVTSLGVLPANLCRWGWGAYRDDPDAQPSKAGPMCSSCDARWDRAGAL